MRILRGGGGNNIEKKKERVIESFAGEKEERERLWNKRKVPWGERGRVTLGNLAGIGKTGA